MRRLSKRVFVFAIAVCFLSVEAYAQIQKASADVTANITKAFQNVRPDWQLQSIDVSRFKGVYKFQVQNGPTVYSSADGEYFIVGDIFQITPKGFVNLAELERDGERAEAMAKIPRKEMIVFSPAQKAKDFVTIFTDIDCGYCRKLHNEVAKINELGIEVRYLAYPRAGIGSQSYNKIVTAWCADDPNEALTGLKQGKKVPLNLCEGNPVAKQYMLGQKLGVSGTPAIITSSGQLLPGYMPAEKLAAALGI
jgi:thiol:disulfide interchange protein DsbC